VWAAITLGVGVLIPVLLSPFWVFLAAQSAIYALLGLSLVLLYRATGSISLAQTSFMGVGAYATAWLFTDHGVSLVPAAVGGVVVAGAVGLLLTLPALRMRGLELTILTLLVGLALQGLVFSSGAPLGVQAYGGAALTPLPSVLGRPLSEPLVLFLICFPLAAGAFWGAWWLLRSRVGLRWSAITNSYAAAAAAGIPISRYKALGFGLSAALAGLAGALVISAQGAVTTDSFGAGPSLALVVIVMIGRIERLAAGVLAGVASGAGQQIAPIFGISGNWLILMFGLVVVAVILSQRTRESGMT
jgi:branched-chain amino acid transport system permease protein